MRSVFVNRRQVLALASTLFANSAATATEFASRPIPTFSRGINFHHLLNWPNLIGGSIEPSYVWPAFATEKFKLSADDIALVCSLGFDFVRLTVDPGIWIAESIQHRVELERRYFDCVENLLAAKLNIVFDLAPVENHPDYTPSRLLAPEEPKNFALYADMVTGAARLLSRAPSDRVALELFNEPPLTGDAGESRWASMQALLHSRARDVAPDLTLILTSSHWGDSAALTRLDASPYSASNVIYTFHYYDPHLFTHQGTKSGAISYISGFDWPVTSEQAKQAERVAEQAVDGDADLDSAERATLRDEIKHDFAGQAASPHDEATVARDFDAVAAWAHANAIAPRRVLLGEFGCVLASRGRPTGASRLRWLTSVRRAAEARGFGWAYWAFKGYGGMELIDQLGVLHANLIAPLGLKAQP